jgi:hypothetical protein
MSPIPKFRSCGSFLGNPSGLESTAHSSSNLQPRRRTVPGNKLNGIAGVILLLIAPASLRAAMPADYQGQVFDDAAYRAEQIAESLQPKLPFNAFAPVLTLWQSKEPKGTGWVGPETPNAIVRLDEPDSAGKRLIHYHVSLSNYRYAAFGWPWAQPQEPAADLRNYDAVSFSIRVTGQKPPQEMFFGITQLQPAPLSLREYDPGALDGSWHRIIIPLRAMKWSGTQSSAAEARGFTFQTFVWEPAEFDVQLDNFALERAASPLATAPSQDRAAVAPAKPPAIPGRLQCAFYDRGGEGVAYHDTTPVNALSSVLNQQPRHRRAHATRYEWDFRRDEGVDVSFTKDWADLNHTNFFDIGPNQLYIGCTEDGEWCQFTVEVRKAGTYRILAAYADDSNGQSFQLSLNHQPACVCRVPLVTGSMHKWNKAEVGRIRFDEPGRHLLTLHYGRGFNLAYFDFEPTTNLDSR